MNKELLSLVLGVKFETYELKDNFINVNNLMLHKYGNVYTPLNLDTLGRLYKEWCLKQDYVLTSFVDHCGSGFCQVSSGVYGMKRQHDIGDTELEAIIKATEWVAKEKGLLSE